MIYDGTCTIADIEGQTKLIAQRGESLLVQRQIPTDIKYKRLIKLTKGEVETVEDNA